MRRTYYVPPRFSPPHSLLGLALRRIVRDRRQAEGIYLVVFPSLILLVILAQFVAWTWVEPIIVADGEGPAATQFFVAQVAGVLLVLLTCGVGFVPAVRVTIEGARLVVRQGVRMRTVAFEAIREHSVVTALRFHREFRPYEAVEAFTSRMTPEVFILDTPQSQVAIGLMAKDRDNFVAVLEAAIVACHEVTRRAAVAA